MIEFAGLPVCLINSCVGYNTVNGRQVIVLRSASRICLTEATSQHMERIAAAKGFLGIERKRVGNLVIDAILIQIACILEGKQYFMELIDGGGHLKSKLVRAKACRSPSGLA